MTPGDVPLFIYGTLKRGHRRHGLLGGSRLFRPLVYAPGYTLVDAGGYPGMVEAESPGQFVEGEIFLIGPETLARLDDYENLASGEYQRLPVCVFDDRGSAHRAHAYLYRWPVENLPLINKRWTTDRESTSPLRHP
ncbi:MAG: gamma-glutamylcyclotransferase [Verrucomicrobiales bacterium]